MHSAATDPGPDSTANTEGHDLTAMQEPVDETEESIRQNDVADEDNQLKAQPVEQGEDPDASWNANNDDGMDDGNEETDSNEPKEENCSDAADDTTRVETIPVKHPSRQPRGLRSWEEELRKHKVTIESINVAE